CIASPFSLQPRASYCRRRLREIGLAHERAGRTDHAPDATELRHVLTEDLACSAIADVVIERSPSVCHLQSATCALGSSEESRLHAATGLRTSLDEVGRPRSRTPADTDALAARIACERIEHKAAAVEQDSPEGRWSCGER